jgi:hypothetical protein
VEYDFERFQRTEVGIIWTSRYFDSALIQHQKYGLLVVFRPTKCKNLEIIATKLKTRKIQNRAGYV